MQENRERIHDGFSPLLNNELSEAAEHEANAALLSHNALLPISQQKPRSSTKVAKAKRKYWRLTHKNLTIVESSRSRCYSSNGGN